MSFLPILLGLQTSVMGDQWWLDQFSKENVSWPNACFCFQNRRSMKIESSQQVAVAEWLRKRKSLQLPLGWLSYYGVSGLVERYLFWGFRFPGPLLHEIDSSESVSAYSCPRRSKSYAWLVSVGRARQKHLTKQNIKWFFFESEKYPEQSVLESFLSAFSG